MSMPERNDVKPSKVLLINLFNYDSNLITHDSYYNIFSNYGKVQKILIFEKAKIWKSFIEMDSVESARKAINSLNGNEILGDGSKFEIFFARYQKLEIDKNKNSGIDYTELETLIEKKEEILRQNQLQMDEQQTKQESDESNLSLDQQRGLDRQFEQQQNKQINKYFQDSLRQLDEQIINFQQQKEFKTKSHQNLGLVSHKSIPSDKLPSFKNFSNYELGSPEERERLRDKFNQLKQQKNQKFLEQNRKSPVIYIRDLDLEIVDGRLLFNLFSNYGNILQVQIFLKKSSALIQYENILFATQAKDYLSYKIWFGRKLRIYYSKYFTLDSRENMNPMQEVVFIPDFKLNLFKNTIVSYKGFMKIKGINIPSETLHVSNISAYADHSQILKLFEAHGQIDDSQFIMSENKQILKGYIRYKTLEESFAAISFLNFTQIYDKQSFSLYKQGLQ